MAIDDECGMNLWEFFPVMHLLNKLTPFFFSLLRPYTPNYWPLDWPAFPDRWPAERVNSLAERDTALSSRFQLCPAQISGRVVDLLVVSICSPSLILLWATWQLLCLTLYDFHSSSYSYMKYSSTCEKEKKSSDFEKCQFVEQKNFAKSSLKGKSRKQ